METNQPTATDSVIVHVSARYILRTRFGPVGRVDYTVYGADGMVFIRVTSKTEVTQLVRKHYGKVAVVFQAED